MSWPLSSKEVYHYSVGLEWLISGAINLWTKNEKQKFVIILTILM